MRVQASSEIFIHSYTITYKRIYTLSYYTDRLGGWLIRTAIGGGVGMI